MKTKREKEKTGMTDGNKEQKRRVNKAGKEWQKAYDMTQSQPYRQQSHKITGLPF